MLVVKKAPSALAVYQVQDRVDLNNMYVIMFLIASNKPRVYIVTIVHKLLKHSNLITTFVVNLRKVNRSS